MACKKHEDEMMLLLLRMKYEAMLRELNVKAPLSGATIEVVRAAADEVEKSVRQNNKQALQENIHELRRLVLEFEDWKSAEDANRIGMMRARFRVLLDAVGRKKAFPGTVSLWSIDAGLTELAKTASTHYLATLRVTATELENWRALCNAENLASVGDFAFWRKLHGVPTQSPNLCTHAVPTRRSNARSRTRSFSSNSATVRTRKGVSSMSERSSTSRSRTRSRSCSSATVILEPKLCDFAPHCKDFDAKHPANAKKKKKKTLDENRRNEYRFLYSAQAHCLQCLQFYSNVEGFNVM